MPAEGWHNVPVREKLYQTIEKRAKEESRTPANLVDVLLRKALEVPA